MFFDCVLLFLKVSYLSRGLLEGIPPWFGPIQVLSDFGIEMYRLLVSVHTGGFSWVPRCFWISFVLSDFSGLEELHTVFSVPVEL